MAIALRGLIELICGGSIYKVLMPKDYSTILIQSIYRLYLGLTHEQVDKYEFGIMHQIWWLSTKPTMH